MSRFVKKEQVLDLVVDSADIIRNIGRGVEKGQIDTASALNNLASALRKLETASDYLRNS
jgi:hypothetical protein